MLVPVVMGDGGGQIAKGRSGVGAAVTVAAAICRGCRRC